jgi:SAM-dependent methyltransferase
MSAAGIWGVGDELAQHLRTVQFYERSAGTYVESTELAGVRSYLEAFAAAVLTGGDVLELGSGSGRDSLWFAERGFEVHAIDACPAMVQATSARAVVRAELARIEEIDAIERYDGIWSSAALLHVAAHRQAEVWARLYRALRPGGALYASYKLGSGQRVADDGRYFFDLDMPRLLSLAEGVGFAEPRAQITVCATGRPTRWVSVLVSKGCRSGSAQSHQLEETRQ